MWPSFFETETIRISTYTVVSVLAWAIGFHGLRNRMREIHIAPLPGPFYLLSTFTVAMMGSHMYWLLLKRPDQVWRAIIFLEPGQVFYGGLISGVLWTIFYAWAKRINVVSFLSCVTAPVALSYSMVRLGCFANGCCWGTRSDLPWAIAYPRSRYGAYAQQIVSGQINVLEHHSLPVHPTPLYAALGGIMLFLILDRLFKQRRSPALLVGVYFLGEGSIRFIVEFFRGDSIRYSGLGLTLAQMISVASAIVGALLIVSMLNSRHRYASASANQVQDHQATARGFSLTELLVVIAIVSMLSAFLLPALGRAQESARRSTCQNNLRSWGQIFQMYSSEATQGRFPPMELDLISYSNAQFALAPKVSSVYPEYVDTFSLFRCPSSIRNSEYGRQDNLLSHPGMSDLSYLYTGYVLDKVDSKSPQRPFSEIIGAIPFLPEDTIESARRRIGPAQVLNWGRAVVVQATFNCLIRPAADLHACGCSVIDSDQTVGIYNGVPVGNADGTVVHRLAWDSGRYVGGGSRLWVMLDSLSASASLTNHAPAGCNVLFLDGHAEFVNYPQNDSVVNQEMACILEPVLNRPR